jgi:hypothetical protein
MTETKKYLLDGVDNGAEFEESQLTLATGVSV